MATYGMQPAQPVQYGAPAPQQNNPYASNPNAPPQQQPNPYANQPTNTAPETADDGGKDIYDEQADDGKDPWVFSPEWDEADELKAKTACCCCSCAFDDCSDWAQIQCESVCLCISSAIVWKLFQCQDQSQRACCLNTQKLSLCDFTSPEEDVMCSLYFCGINGIFCLCCSGKAYESICDPCEMPTTFCKGMSQLFCIHHRMALPCDDDVPFEIYCCGMELYTN